VSNIFGSRLNSLANEPFHIWLAKVDKVFGNKSNDVEITAASDYKELQVCINKMVELDISKESKKLILIKGGAK
jgi:hypothetical protein